MHRRHMHIHMCIRSTYVCTGRADDMHMSAVHTIPCMYEAVHTVARMRRESYIGVIIVLLRSNSSE